MVDDYEPWCQFLSSTISATGRWQIAATVCDGAEGVRQATMLQPDLILLDIGLPTMNGLEAARRILDVNADARILFITEHRAWEVAEEALCTGARGYVVKSDAGRELLPAMNTIIEGGRFIGAGLAGRPLEERGHELVRAVSRHEVVFSSHDVTLLDYYVQAAQDALNAGDTFLIAASDARRAQLQARLEAMNIDVAHAIRKGRYVSRSADEVLASVLVDGWPSEARFWDATTSLMLQAAQAANGERPRVVTCGECAPLLWEQGRGASAVQLERLCNEFVRTYNMDVLCGYSSHGHYQDPHGDIYRAICAEHTAVYSR